jgi:hypothetical protein
MIRGALLFTVLFSCILCYSQTIVAKWEKSSVQIGDHAKLSLKAQGIRKSMKHIQFIGDQPCQFRLPSSNLWEAKGLFEVLNFKDSTFMKSGKLNWEATYTIIFWDSAYYRLPPFQLKDSLGIIEVAPTDIYVGFVKKKYNPDIDELKVVPVFTPAYILFLKKWWWLFLLFLAFVIALIFWNKRTRNVSSDTRGIKQITLDELTALRVKKLWLKEKSPQHYFEFTYILKRFLGTIYGISIIERTTNETIILLKTKGVDILVTDRIKEILIEADLIKFAKNTAEHMRVESTLTRAEELVIELSPIETIQATEELNNGVNTLNNG